MVCYIIVHRIKILKLIVITEENIMLLLYKNITCLFIINNSNNKTNRETTKLKPNHTNFSIFKTYRHYFIASNGLV